MDKILFSAYTDDEELAYSRVMNRYFLSDKAEPEWCQMIKPKYNKKMGQDDISVGLYISRGEGQHINIMSSFRDYLIGNVPEFSKGSVQNNHSVLMRLKY